MKNLLKLLSVACLLAVVMLSCKKDENKVFYEGGTPPVLSASSTADLFLSRPNAGNNAVVFSWTNPDYKFNTGVSSQNITYVLQIDTTGSNFTNPSIQEASISNDLGVTLTEKELNQYLTNLNLTSGVQYPVEFRIKSTLVNNSAPLYSNVLKINVTPYEDVLYPVPPALYITGAATPLSWQCACSTDDPGDSQKFTKNGTKFEITIALSANNSYLLIPRYSHWDPEPNTPFPGKYGGLGANNTNNVNGDDFKPEGGDLKAPATSGNYKITVEFKTGRFTVVPQ